MRASAMPHAGAHRENHSYWSKGGQRRRACHHGLGWLDGSFWRSLTVAARGRTAYRRFERPLQRGSSIGTASNGAKISGVRDGFLDWFNQVNGLGERPKIYL